MIFASFSPGAGLLSIFGDANDGAITVSRNIAGSLFVNGGAVAIVGGTPTVANTTQIQIFGQEGNDTLVLDESNGALPRVSMFGGAGNDTAIGGSGADFLFGQAGNDTLLGKGGNDILIGGDGDDRIIWNPGDGSDVVEGQDGTDTLLFNGSAGAEIFEVSANGGRVRFTRDLGSIVMDIDDVERIDLNVLGGADTVIVNDLSGTDVKIVSIDLSAPRSPTPDGENPVSPKPDGEIDTVIVDATNGDNEIVLIDGAVRGSLYFFSMDLSGLSPIVVVSNVDHTKDRLVVNGLDGDDFIGALSISGIVTNITLDGGAGDDTILGSNGADVLIGGDGDDFIDGNQGADTAFLGLGNDVFQWDSGASEPRDRDPGDGSDIVNGGFGYDTLDFRGASTNETFGISANRDRALLTRSVGTIAMDLGGIERIKLAALGGTDTIVVGDLTGTAVRKVEIDLAGSLGGGAGDGSIDSIIVNSTNGPHEIVVRGTGTSISVSGVAPAIDIRNVEGQDRLAVNGLGASDVINAAALDAGVVTLILDGGEGGDVIHGSRGSDVLIGGDGDDVVLGKQGADTAFLGTGDDFFIWDPGDGSDTVEGGDGTDTLFFHGASAEENFDIVANGERALLRRNVGAIAMDLNEVETIHIDTLGGADTIVVGDLGGTDVTLVEIDLGGVFRRSGADGAIDTIIVNATDSDDDIIAETDADGVVRVIGLPAGVSIIDFEAQDRLVIAGGAGDDLIDAEWLEGIALTIDGGQGDDLVLGSTGDDRVLGGRGDDVALLCDGDDTFVWHTRDGSDVIDGEAGFDTLRITDDLEQNAPDHFEISANAGLTQIIHDAFGFVDALEVAGVEVIEVAPGPVGGRQGGDRIVVNDLGGTDVTRVTIAPGFDGPGPGSQAPDAIVINATEGDDTIVIVIVGDARGIQILGLAVEIEIFSFDAFDNLVINGLGGDDVIDASGLSGIQFFADGGDGDDILQASAGTDTLIGGAGDDIFFASADDVLDAVPGDIVFIV